MNEIDLTEITEREGLAVVYVIDYLEDIQGKDKVVLCHMKDCGYTAVVEKGIHKPNDYVIFIKYDTVVPDNILFDFMREFKFRIKPKSFTIKDHDGCVIDKIYSQGIVLPFKTVTDYIDTTDFWDKLEESGFEGSFIQWNPLDDMTKLLGIKKYIPPVHNSGTTFGKMQSAGDFPSHIVSKTDEMNLSSKMKALEELKDKPFVISLKYEGSSETVFYDEGELVVCSRNNKLKQNDNKFWQAIEKYHLETKLVDCPYVFQMELVGPAIQKNKLGLTEVDVRVFNVSEKYTRKRINENKAKEITESYGLPWKQIILTGNSFNITFEELQNLADKQKYPNGETAEGIVIRPTEPFQSKVLKDIWSVKVINRNYTL